jgi:phosphatidylinositol-3-phosphatase
MRTRGLTLSLLLALTVLTTGAAAGAAQRVRHVFIIVLENKNYDDTFRKSTQDPYLQKKLPAEGALLTQYFGTGHNSLDNYLSMISGQGSSIATEGDCPEFEDFVMSGVDKDGQAVGKGCVYPPSIKTLADQMQAAGLRWKGYMEDMGNDPARENATCGHPPIGAKDLTQAPEAPTASVPKGDQYATRHDPFVYFHSIIDQPDCKTHVVNLDALPADLASIATTPHLSFITPNLCNDGHDGSGTGAKGQGCADGKPGGLASIDAFLQSWVPKITASPAFKKDGLLIITFDESNVRAAGAVTDPVTKKKTITVTFTGEHCCNQQIGPNVTRPSTDRFVDSPTEEYVVKNEGYGGDRVGAVLLSPFIKPGTVSNQPYNHYALLRSLEDIYALEHLGFAGQQGLTPFGNDIFSQP